MLQSLLKWSLTQSDGIEASKDVKPMSPEDRKWLEAALNKYVMDETERINLIVRMLEYNSDPSGKSSSTKNKPVAATNASKSTTSETASKKKGVEAKDIIRGAKEAELDARLAKADAAGVLEMKANGLEELIDRLCQIDNAKFFALRHGGSGKLPLLLDLMRPGQPKSLRWRAASVFATVVQNNPEPQAKAMELGALDFMMKLVTDEKDPKVRTKVFYALSSMVRGEETSKGQQMFVKAGGLKLLGELIGETGSACPSSLRNKALFTGLWVLDGDTQLRRQFVKQGALPHILPLIGHDDIDTAEKSLQVLLLLAKDDVCVRALRVIRVDGIFFTQMVQSLARRLGALTDSEDIEYNEERLALLRQIDACLAAPATQAASKARN